jgi:superfamily II DNA or RNA helicase
MSLSLDRVYRSAGAGVGRDFFARVLPATRLYKRAAGFFSSSVFNAAAGAWEEFFEAGGEVQLVCSNRLSSSDVAALKSAVIDRPRWRRRMWEDVLISANPRTSTSDFLSWLVANDRLILKIAVVKLGPKDHLYHEKIGVLLDAEGNALAISGSANETFSAWAANFERVDLFPSWDCGDAKVRCMGIQDAFAQLWCNKTDGLEVLNLGQAVLDDQIIESSTEDSIALNAPIRTILDRFTTPELLLPAPEIELFEHQRAAIDAWARSRGRGILEMATGSGKTVTALHLASKLYDAIGPGLCVLIVAPLIHLVDQWIKEAQIYGLRPIRCAEGVGRWLVEVGVAIDSLNNSSRPIASLVATSATLSSESFMSQLRRIRRPLLIIGDEVHNYGSREYASALPNNAQYRLGLSATPCRWMDPEGTKRITSYFGDVVYKYGLREAIRDKILTPYRYYPTFVELCEEEFEVFVDLSRFLSRYGSRLAELGDLPESAKTLLFKRARLLASAKGKIPLLRGMLSLRLDDDHILVYCGDGSVEGADDGDLVRQVEAVTTMIGSELGMRCASYTARTPAARRRELLVEFAAGAIQVLVAIRCLDEGVDVPSTRTAYILASSTNPRQFVQRRGRVLRRAQSKRRAEIYDFFVTPPIAALTPGHPAFSFAKSLLRGQVARAAEFAELAENGPVARRDVMQVLSKAHLLDTWESSDE